MKPQMDINAIVGGYLRDLAFVQPSRPQMFGYKRAASAILALEVPLTEVLDGSGTLQRIRGIGPASTRIIHEVLSTGASPTVEKAIDAMGRREDIERRRGLRQHFLSRAEALRILGDPSYSGPGREDYRGDLQMHSEWSDGTNSVAEIAAACHARGYSYSAITDHSYGLKIAGGMSMAEAAEQRRAIDDVNRAWGTGFRLLQGVEANIGIDGQLDLSDDEAASFDLVLAAPHSLLRKDFDQTPRLVAAIRSPRVRILAHPRGRMAGSRAGIVADWSRVFSAAAANNVAIEIDGDPARQDIDYTLVERALEANCLFALDSDAHGVAQLRYADTALAHARLAGVPIDRIVNCWTVERLLEWLVAPQSKSLSA